MCRVVHLLLLLLLLLLVDHAGAGDRQPEHARADDLPEHERTRDDDKAADGLW